MGRRSASGRKRNAPTLACVRSAISNGSRILDGCDHRSATMRRLRDLVAAHVNDLGGADNISEAEQVLVRRAAMLTLQAEMMESRWSANGGEATVAQIDVYQRLVGALRRTLEALGLKRRMKDATPTLDEYLSRKHRGHVIDGAAQ